MVVHNWYYAMWTFITSFFHYYTSHSSRFCAEWFSFIQHQGVLLKLRSLKVYRGRKVQFEFHKSLVNQHIH